MSDSTKDTRQRAGRGSLLDHVGDQPPAQVSAHDRGRDMAGRDMDAPARPLPSLLATPARSVRLPTARTSGSRNTAAEPVPAAASPVHAEPGPVQPNREKFGDRIARLIGTITPEGHTVAPPETVETVDSTPAFTAPEPPPQEDRSPRGPAPRNPAAARNDEGRDDHYHWHAAESDDGSRPLLDASILISAVWRYRYLIGAATVAGAVLGIVVALVTPHQFYAESRLFVDPREIRVTEDDIRNQQLSTEAMLAIIDSQLQILTSTSVLEKVIADLGLDRDPEFNGSLPTGGLSGGLSLIKEIFTKKGGQSDAEQKALQNLRDAVSVGRDAKTFVLILGVETRDPEKSALIANKIVETYLASEGQAQSSLLERTSESIDTRLNALRSDLDKAEREVERFKAENGLVGVAGQFIDDQVILALSEQLASARAMKIGIKVKADNLARVKLDDVLSGAFPEELLSDNLTALRKQYTDTRSNADSLATRLGPRHPQYIAAQSALATISREIGAELRRIVASSQTELQRAIETEQELASQMAVAKNRAMDQSVEFVTLRELERKANATRGIYEDFLTRSRETSERSNLSTRNVRVISPAEAPLQPMGPSRKLIAVGGTFAGLFAGLGLALLAGAVESIRAYNAGPVQARFQNPPFGGYPSPPASGPRTPPGGPSRRSWSRRDETVDAALDRAADEATAQAFSAARARPGHQLPAAVPASAAAAAVQDPAPLPREEPVPAPLRPEPRPLDLAQTVYAPAQPGPLPPRGYPQPVAQTGHLPWQAETAQAQPQPVYDIRQDQAAPRFEPTQPGYNPMSMPGHPGLPPQPMAAPRPSAYPSGGQDPRMPQPLWSAYPAQLPPQHQGQQAYPFHPGPVVDPYAPAHPVMQPGYAAPYAGHPMPQPQPVVMPPQAPQPVMIPPQAYALQPQMAQPYGQPPQLHGMQQPMAAPHPAAVWLQPQPAPAAMPYPAPHPFAPAPQAVHPEPALQPPQPVHNQAVDRIRRDMDTLKSRIVEFGSGKRRA